MKKEKFRESLTDYLGRSTSLQTLLVWSLSRQRRETLTYKEVSKGVGIEGVAFGGAFTALTYEVRDFPPFLLASSAKTVYSKDTKKAVGKTRIWKKNEGLDWKVIENETASFIDDCYGGVDSLKKEVINEYLN